MPDSRLPALFVLSGLADATACAAPVPAPALAQLQLRAINHRASLGPADDAGALREALTHSDFLATRSDGAWLSRSAFIAQAPSSAPADDASLVEEPVRLFGPVALVHGVFASAGTRLRYTDVHLWSGAGWRLISTQDAAMQHGVALALATAAAPRCAAWRGQDPVGDDPAVLQALNARYVQSFREADVAWYDAHLAPDYVVIASSGAYQDRSAALAHFALPTFAQTMQSFPVDRVRVRQFGDVALIHAANAYTLKDGRQGESRYTDIWRRDAGRWLCVAAHITAHTAAG